MKYLSRLLVIVGMATSLVACNDNTDIIDPYGPQPNDMQVNLAMSFPGMNAMTRSKVSGTENFVHTMQMLCFDANGLYLGIRNAEVESAATATPWSDTGIIKGTVPQGTSRIHFIANRSLNVPLSFSNGTTEAIVMQSEQLSTIWNDAAHQEICYWGYHREANATAMTAWLDGGRVYMIRDRAKVVLSYEPSSTNDKVTHIDWLIHGGRERGYLAPYNRSNTANPWADYYTQSTIEGQESVKIASVTLNEYTECDRYTLWTSDTENDEENFDFAYDKTNSSRVCIPQYIFDDDNPQLGEHEEHPEDFLKVIMRVTYSINGNSETRYHIVQLKDELGTYDILRNNTYYVKITFLTPEVGGYLTLEDAVKGKEFTNADIEIDRTVPDINDDTYAMQIKLPNDGTSVVFNTTGEHNMDFMFLNVSDLSNATTTATDFEIKWEHQQYFASDPTWEYDSNAKKWVIKTNVTSLTENLQSEWLVIRHKNSGLTRYIHVFVIDQFRFLTPPTLKKAGNDYVLNFQIPPQTATNATDAMYPATLYPIDVKFTTNTLNAYGIAQNQTNYGYFGVSVESTGNLFEADSFETDYVQLSSSATADMANWWFQQAEKLWDFWYTYSIKTYPTNGQVNIYFKDVRDHIKYATVANVGLYMHIDYFGKVYALKVTE